MSLLDSPRVRMVSGILTTDGVWLVGGVVRDSILGRQSDDIDLVVAGDAEALARALAGQLPGAVFPLSDEFGGWRVVPREGGWQIDLTPLADGGLEEDLARRDFTINAIAVPLAGGAEVDPHGGRADAGSGLLRAVGPQSFESDPLRVVRLARFASCLGLAVEPGTVELSRRSAARLGEVAGERVLNEFLGLMSGPDPVGGVELLDAAGGLREILPEIEEIDGVEQSSYHHLDVWGHTLAVLASVVELERDPSRLGPAGEDARSLLGGDLADGVDRWCGVRLGALLHDVAKGRTRKVFDGGRVGFPGHDELGSAMCIEILKRMRASSKLGERVATLTEHHLAAGFMTHHLPIGERDVHRYLVRIGAATVDVTVLSVADRLATLGRKSGEAIERHLLVTDQLLEAAVKAEVGGLPKAPIRGDELASELGIDHGPLLGELISELETAVYAGEVTSREDAIDWARSLIEASD